MMANWVQVLAIRFNDPNFDPWIPQGRRELTLENYHLTSILLHFYCDIQLNTPHTHTRGGINTFVNYPNQEICFPPLDLSEAALCHFSVHLHSLGSITLASPESRGPPGFGTGCFSPPGCPFHSDVSVLFPLGQKAPLYRLPDHS